MKRQNINQYDDSSGSQDDSDIVEITIEIEPEEKRTVNRPGLSSDLTVKFRSVEPDFWSQTWPIERLEASKLHRAYLTIEEIEPVAVKICSNMVPFGHQKHAVLESEASTLLQPQDIAVPSSKVEPRTLISPIPPPIFAITKLRPG